MNKPAKKTAKAKASPKPTLASARELNAPKFAREVKEAQDEAVTIELANAEYVINNANETMAEVMHIGSNNTRALKECGTITTGVLRDLGSELMANYRDSVSDCIEISKKALECRTTSDIVDFQSKTLERVIKAYFDKSTKLSEILFAGYTKALAPMNEVTAISTDRVRKLLAA